MIRKEIRERANERSIGSNKKESLEIKELCQTLLKGFDMSSSTAKKFPKCRREKDQDSER